jgi:hypothetical protein
LFTPAQLPPDCPPGGSQIVDGRQPHIGVPEQLAGMFAQNGAGGVQGGGMHPTPCPPSPTQLVESVQPEGH